MVTLASVHPRVSCEMAAGAERPCALGTDVLARVVGALETVGRVRAGGLAASGGVVRGRAAVAHDDWMSSSW